MDAGISVCLFEKRSRETHGSRALRPWKYPNNGKRYRRRVLRLLSAVLISDSSISKLVNRLVDMGV